MSGPERYAAGTTICVLGMHRSGSSLVTQILHRAGARLGPRVLGPSASNPDGHFEDRFVLGVNKRLLRRFGGTWDRPPELPDSWLQDPEVVRLRIRATAYRDQVVRPESPFLFKDPRTCLLLPFWRRVFGPMTYVVVLRSPQSVVRSMVRRNREWRRLSQLPWRVRRTLGNWWLGEHEPLFPIDAGRAHALWHRYYDEVVRETNGRRVVVAVYERLVTDPEPHVAELVHRVMPGSGPPPDGAVKPDLDHAADTEISEDVWDYVERLGVGRPGA